MVSAAQCSKKKEQWQIVAKTCRPQECDGLGIFEGDGGLKALYLRHQKWLEKQHLAVYSFVVAADSLVLRGLLVAILSPILSLVPADRLYGPELDIPLYYVLVIAPVIETAFLQWLPISIASWLKQTKPFQISASAFLFAAGHWSAGVLSILAALVAGFFLANAWVRWRGKGISAAFAVVALMHFWMNLAAVAATALAARIS